MDHFLPGNPSLVGLIQVLALSTTRIGVAFLLLPAFSPDVLPGLIRNATFLAFGIITLAVQPAIDTHAWSAWTWLSLFAKEAFIGAALGLWLGSVLWAFEAAGQFIDTHANATQAQISDPLSGEQVTLSGALLGRLVNFVFMFGGGFLMWVACLVESYAVWPVARLSLSLPLNSALFFEGLLTQFTVTTLLVAGPAMIALFMLDSILGLASRFAPQLNVYSIASAIKTLAAILVWFLLLGTVVDYAESRLNETIRLALPRLSAWLGP